MNDQVEAVWDELAGQYQAQGGRWIRLQTNWPHHTAGQLAMLGLSADATKYGVSYKLATVDADQFAEAAMQHGLSVLLLTRSANGEPQRFRHAGICWLCPLVLC